MSLPHVTALITAYNCERFIGEAVDSVLAQDYEGPLDLVVIEDGSTDGTARELAKRADDPRLRIVAQENRGYMGASTRAVEESTGELLAWLDGDDAWPADKLRHQVPALGDADLLYGDMTVIDVEGTVIDESWLSNAVTPEGRRFVALLRQNPATSSSVLMRADLARDCVPFPPGIVFADWYFVIRAAQRNGVRYLPEPRTRYRFHGSNMSLGSTGTHLTDQLREALGFQRWFMRQLVPGDAPGAELWQLWEAFEAFAAEIQRVDESPFTPLVEVSAQDRAESIELIADTDRALERGDALEAVTTAIRAVAADPWSEPARERARLAASHP